MLSRRPEQLGRMLDCLEAKCLAETRAVYAASHDGANYNDVLLLAALSSGVDDDEQVPQGEAITFFHSRVLPKASLRTLAASMLRSRVGIDRATISIAAVLMLRYNATRPVTAHMMHRLFVACVLVGAKAHQDTFPCNKLLGKAVGITLAETNRFEIALISALNWRLVVTQQDVNDAFESLACPARGATDSEFVSGDSSYVPRDGHNTLPISSPEHP